MDKNEASSGNFPPFRIHPKNSKVFEFRGQPRVLVCATEHYGAVMNRPFDFERYLADAAEKGQTLTRLFTLFRELQAAVNPFSTCKPESPDYIAPFRRVGPKRALDGEPQYDLNQWNPEFFERLHRFLSLASDHGIVVEVVLLSATYGDAIWALNPLHAGNNVNGLKEIPYPEYISKRHADLFDWQCRHVRKIVEETNRYDNIFYEICNEPDGPAVAGPGAPSTDEVNEWQCAIAEVIRETEKRLPNHHLIAGHEASIWTPPQQPADKSFGGFPVDVVNIHPLPNTVFGGKSYDMGQFMAKQLKLQAVRDFCLATYAQTKPLNYDEDNAATQYKDVDGWTIHRKRAWTTLFSGGHYDFIDFSITIHTPTGTPESQQCIRAWMQHLSRFIHSVDLVRARPLTDWLREKPAATLESVLAVPGEDYCIYLADKRELDETGVGGVMSGEVGFDLPDGEYLTSHFSPVTGLSSPSVTLRGGKNVNVHVPPFQHDLVVRITRTDRSAA